MCLVSLCVCVWNQGQYIWAPWCLSPLSQRPGHMDCHISKVPLLRGMTSALLLITATHPLPPHLRHLQTFPSWSPDSRTEGCHAEGWSSLHHCNKQSHPVTVKPWTAGNKCHLVALQKQYKLPKRTTFQLVRFSVLYQRRSVVPQLTLTPPHWCQLLPSCRRDAQTWGWVWSWIGCIITEDWRQCQCSAYSLPSLY